MKKIYALIIFVVFVFLLAGCKENVSSELVGEYNRSQQQGIVKNITDSKLKDVEAKFIVGE